MFHEGRMNPLTAPLCAISRDTNVIENQNFTLKKGDKVTMAILGLVGLTIFSVVGVYALPYIILALENTLYTVFLAIALLVVTMPIWDTGTRTAFLYGWKNFSRNLCRFITRQNPIGVLTTAISRFEARLADITEKMNQAAGAMKRHKQKMDDAKKRAEEAEALYHTAVSSGRAQAIQNSQLTAAGRWNKAYETMQPMYDLLKEMHEAFIKAREVCQYRLEDLKNQKEVLSVQYETMMASQKAAKSFKSFFGANPDLAMLQMSVDEAERQIADAEAEIEQVLRDATPMIDAANLQKEADAQAALARIKGSKLLAEPSPSTALPSTIKQAQLVGRQ